MSSNIHTSSISMFFSFFFGALSVTLAFIKLTFGLHSIFQKGIDKNTAPSLWIMIPVFTLYGITFVRLFAGINHNFFDTNPNPFIVFLVLSVLLSLQIVFGSVGYMVMKKIGYFKDFVYGELKKSRQFYINLSVCRIYRLRNVLYRLGHRTNRSSKKYSLIHFLLMTPFILSQMKGIELISRLSKRICTKKMQPN